MINLSEIFRTVAQFEQDLEVAYCAEPDGFGGLKIEGAPWFFRYENIEEYRGEWTLDCQIGIWIDTAENGLEERVIGQEKFEVCTDIRALERFIERWIAVAEAVCR